MESCKKHHPECHNFEKRMAAEAKAYLLRAELESAQGEAERLKSQLARVGMRESEYAPPDTRPACFVPTEWGQCGERALESGLCAAHEAQEVGL